MHEENDIERLDLDNRINAALVDYGEADSGLERRVLARLSVERKYASRLGRMAWAALSIAAAACIILSAVLMRVIPFQHQKGATVHTPSLRRIPTDVDHASTLAPLKKKEPTRHFHADAMVGKSVASRLPKLDVFPTPQPLSPTELMLVNFAAQAPKTIREDFVRNQEQPSGAIAIAAIGITPIQIPPLEPPDSGAN